VLNDISNASRTKITGAPAQKGLTKADARQNKASSTKRLSPQENVKKQKVLETENIVIVNFDVDRMSLDSVPVALNEVEDIDINDSSDPQYAALYAQNIHDHLKKKEKADMMNYYMDWQSKVGNLTDDHRQILVDWLVDVHRACRLQPEVLFLAVRLLDIYLSKQVTTKASLQQVGVTCLFVAAKFEEVQAPSLRDFLYLSDELATVPEILKLEEHLLTCVSFNLTTPTSLQFARRYSKAGKANTEMHTMAKYLIEMALLDLHLQTSYPPSHVAAAAVYLARLYTNTSPVWDVTLQFYSNYTADQVLPCAKALYQFIRRSASKEGIQASRQKYANPKLFSTTQNLDAIDLKFD